MAQALLHDAAKLAPEPIASGTWAPGNRESRSTRRRFLLGGSAVALALYAGTHPRHELEVTQRTISVRNLPPALEGFRLVQLSDIHYDEYTEPWFVREVVRRTNALNPDLLVITGDFISRGPLSESFARRKIGECADILTGLACPQRFCVLGNHDATVGPDYIAAALHERGLPVLDDSYLPIARGDARLWLCGARDPGVLDSRPERAIPAAPDGPVIYLAHEPDFADVLMRSPRFPVVDLMLSGHSHGGQVRLPFVGPIVLPPLGQKYISGHFQLGHMQLYVNRGIGTVGLPFRLNCPPEITEFTLIPA